ncbi:MAG: thioredoxin family protein [Hyphomicrobiales bacterium]
MNRILSLLLVLLLVAGCWAGSEDTSTARIQWVPDLSEGLRQAKETGKPAMLFFTADWCAPCLELKKHVFSDKRVIETSSRLVNIYVDVDKNYDAIAAYKVRGIPAIFFSTPGGEIVERIIGGRPVARLVEQMTAIADKYTR